MMKTSFLSLLLALLLAMPALAQLPNTLSPAEKVYGLSKFWQEVNYNLVYLDKVDRTAWDAEYVRLIDEVQKTENDYAYYRLLQKFCAQLNDGHTNVYPPKEIWDQLSITDFTDYRLKFANVDGHVVVSHVSESKKQLIPVGSEVVAVNGLPTRTYQEKEVIPYISSSTDYMVDDLAALFLLMAPQGTQYNVKFRLPKGKEKELNLTVGPVAEEAVYPSLAKPALLELSWKPGNIAHLALNSFSDPAIDSLFLARLPELRKAKGLIIDLRKNGGGSSTIGFTILQYFTNDQELFGARSYTRQHLAAHKAWGKWTSAEDTVNNADARRTYQAFHDQLMYAFPYESSPVNAPENERVVVPTVILIGHNTASAAEDFLIFADNQKHMLKMGEPTFGSTGQPYMFEMPGGGWARVCAKKDVYPDGREFVGYGIQPDLLIKPTLDDYINDRDPVLEKAQQQLKGQLKASAR